MPSPSARHQPPHLSLDAMYATPGNAFVDGWEPRELGGEWVDGPAALTADGNLLRDRDGQVVGMMSSRSWARIVAGYAEATEALRRATRLLAAAEGDNES